MGRVLVGFAKIKEASLTLEVRGQHVFATCHRTQTIQRFTLDSAALLTTFTLAKHPNNTDVHSPNGFDSYLEK
jgi:hypothetical protein